MKRNHNRKKNNTSIKFSKHIKKLAETYLAQAVICIEVMFVALAFILLMFGAAKGIRNSNTNKSNTTHIERTLTKKQFDTKSPVDITFSELTTTSEQYDILRNECDKYVKSSNISATSLDTKVNIAEDTYIDTNGHKIINNKDDTMHETGPIYLQDKLIIRYINEKGEMKVVASKLDIAPELYDIDSSPSDQFGLDKLKLLENRQQEFNIETFQGIENQKNTISNNDIGNSNRSEVNNIITVDVNNLKDIFDTQGVNKFNSEISYDIKEIIDNQTTEDDYLKDLSNIFLEVIGKSSDNIDNTLKIKALQYFSYEGYTTIIEGMEYIDSSYTTIQVNFIEAGKSDIEIPYKDRIIMQIETSNNTSKILTNIVIKLNDSYKVFDIDII